MSQTSQYSRRSFISTVALSGAALPFAIVPGKSAKRFSEQPDLINGNKIHVFSKPLQEYNYEELASILAEAGAEGTDLSVRKGGHVLPENVETDLPKAVAAARKKGLVTEMIVTSITDADDPSTERILKTASSLGIKYYRMGYFDYDETLGVWNSLQKIKPALKKLEAQNRKYQIHGAYQNHFGKRVGGSVWDLYELFRDFDPQFLGCQYDVRHAVAEGGGSWTVGMKLLAPWIKCTDLKDFRWTADGKKMYPESVPMGEGIINFDEYFKLAKQFGLSGPISVHFEYPPFERSNQNFSPDEKKKMITNAIKKDVDFIKNYLHTKDN